MVCPRFSIGFGTSVLARGAQAGSIDGIGVYTRALGNALAARSDAQVRLVSFGRHFDRESPIFEGTRLASLDVVDAGRFATRAVLSASTQLAFPGSGRWTRDLDLFHATDHYVPRLRTIPVVATLMDAIPLTRPEWVQTRARAAKNWLWRRTAGWAQRIVTISAHSRAEIIDAFRIPEARVDVIPLGVEADSFGTLTEEECRQVLSDFNLTPPFFLFIGTIQPRKNVERIIAAHERLPAALRREVPLVLAGRYGWGCDELLQRLQTLSPATCVRWLRYVDDGQARALMQQARALVFPSLHEGFGLPVLEAFASGLPVITSTTTALPEVAGDAALLVDPVRTDEIAGAMLRLLDDDSLRQALREAGSARVREFTWERCADRMMQIYRQTIDD